MGRTIKQFQEEKKKEAEEKEKKRMEMQHQFNTQQMIFLPRGDIFDNDGTHASFYNNQNNAYTRRIQDDPAGNSTLFKKDQNNKKSANKLKQDTAQHKQPDQINDIDDKLLTELGVDFDSKPASKKKNKKKPKNTLPK